MIYIKRLIKEHSPYFLFVVFVQIIISVIATLALVYSDTEIFGDVALFDDLDKLISSVYSQSWWALILFSLSFASILSLTALVYKRLEYEFLSIGCIVIMIIPSINVNHNITDILLTIFLFLPIIAIKIIAYRNELRVLNKNNRHTKKGK